MFLPISNGPLVPPVRFSPSPEEAATEEFTISSLSRLVF